MDSVVESATTIVKTRLIEQMTLHGRAEGIQLGKMIDVRHVSTTHL
jgi:hypothetical protein